MEATVLGSLLQVVFYRLASPIIEKFQNSIGFNEENEKLQDQLPMIQTAIEDAEQVQDTRVEIWLNKLRNVIDNADKLFDEPSCHVGLKTRDEVVTMFSTIELFGDYLRLPPKLKVPREMRRDD